MFTSTNAPWNGIRTHRAKSAAVVALVALVFVVLLTKLVGQVSAGEGSAASPLAAATPPGEGKASLPFEPNVGQADSAARYVAHQRGGTVSFAQSGVLIAVNGPRPRPAAKDADEVAEVSSASGDNG